MLIARPNFQVGQSKLFLWDIIYKNNVFLIFLGGGQRLGLGEATPPPPVAMGLITD